MRDHELGRLEDRLDPSWYQALYGFAAVRFNQAVASWTIATFLVDPGRQPFAAAVARPSIARHLLDRPLPPDGLAALREATHVARQLAIAAIEMCEELPSQPVRRPRVLVSKTRRRRLREQTVRGFLEAQVYDTGTALLAATLQLNEFALGAAKTARVPEGTAERVDVLRGDTLPDREDLLRPLLARLSTASDRGASVPLSYRVRYNLACYYAREIVHDISEGEEGRPPRDAEPIRLLQSALNGAPPNVAELMRKRTQDDPAFAVLGQIDEGLAKLVSVDAPGSAASEVAALRQKWPPFSLRSTSATQNPYLYDEFTRQVVQRLVPSTPASLAGEVIAALGELRGQGQIDRAALRRRPDDSEVGAVVRKLLMVGPAVAGRPPKREA